MWKPITLVSKLSVKMGSITPQRTVLRILDDIATKDPNQVYCVHPVSSDIAQGWKTITFADLHSAINRLALWINEHVASPAEPQTLAYMGANDIRYIAFVFACMRLRHTVRSETSMSHKSLLTSFRHFFYRLETRSKLLPMS